MIIQMWLIGMQKRVTIQILVIVKFIHIVCLVLVKMIVLKLFWIVRMMIRISFVMHSRKDFTLHFIHPKSCHDFQAILFKSQWVISFICQLNRIESQHQIGSVAIHRNKEDAFSKRNVICATLNCIANGNVNWNVWPISQKLNANVLNSGCQVRFSCFFSCLSLISFWLVISINLTILKYFQEIIEQVFVHHRNFHAM